VVGAIFLAGHAAEQWWRGRPIVHLVGTLVAMALLVSVNPYGVRYYSYLAHALTMDRRMIVEWLPLWSAAPPAVAVTLLSMLVAVLALRRTGLSRAAGWPLLVVSAAAALRSQRHVSIYALVWLAYVPALVSSTSLGDALERVQQRWGVFLWSFLLVVGLAYGARTRPWDTPVMGRTTSRLNELIESVLQFSRIDRGRIDVAVSAFDLQHILQEIRDEHRHAAEHKGLTLSLSSTPLAALHSDPGLVRLIVSNLVQNAIKFTASGTVEIVSVSDGRTHRIAVRDTGRGIPSEHHARIFDPFEQLEPSRGKHTPGVGLGLSLAKAMSSALHGRIELESALGAGSIFTLVLSSLHLERP